MGHTVQISSLMQMIPARVTGESHNERFAREEQEKANARLIAAAPEMLALLERLEDSLTRDACAGDDYDSYTLASGALADISQLLTKARGR
jgi:hypothetical protein